MSNFYLDREQSQAKHEILRRYLVPFANKILSSWHSIDFIDGFSGPWKNADNEKLSDTSIGVALRTLSDVAEQRKHTSTDRRIRCIFNEAKPQPYARLREFVERSRPDFPLLKIETFQGEFESNAAAISRAADHQFQLLFVDPTGYTGFPPSSLRMFNGRSSEIIVNFMRSFIERFVSGDHEDRQTALAGLIGPDRAQFLLDTGLTIEKLEAEYLSMLRADLKYEFAGFSPIHNPDKNQIHFNLAYATNHSSGMEVMRNAEFAALTEHDRARFKRKSDRQGGDLFEGMFDQMEVAGPYFQIRKAHRDRADRDLERLLTEHTKGIEFSKLAAIAQQTLFLKRSELGDVLVEMSGEGRIAPTWKIRGGRKPVDKDEIVLL